MKEEGRRKKEEGRRKNQKIKFFNFYLIPYFQIERAAKPFEVGIRKN
ncbi:hypothetical protein [Tychonema sp. LEGE 07203]|nr:hypothetical protein [Tychonema sp. LEGE 07203]MBE9093187.1 hypothetical protein [Tychonema sp. LEGE 07203]